MAKRKTTNDSAAASESTVGAIGHAIGEMVPKAVDAVKDLAHKGGEMVDRLLHSQPAKKKPARKPVSKSAVKVKKAVKAAASKVAAPAARSVKKTDAAAKSSKAKPAGRAKGSFAKRAKVKSAKGTK